MGRTIGTMVSHLFFGDKEKYGKMRESKPSTWQGRGILPYLEVVLTNESKKCERRG